MLSETLNFETSFLQNWKQFGWFPQTGNHWKQSLPFTWMDKLTWDKTLSPNFQEQ